MKKSTVLAVLIGLAASGPQAWAEQELEFDIARFYIEYNSTDNDLGFHVFLDGEDWNTLRIVNPRGRTLFEVQGRGGYRKLGLTELFFEGAEPTLFDVPLAELLALFPEGEYEFEGTTIDGEEVEGEAMLSYAVPAGPDVSARLGRGNSLTIRWKHVTDGATDPAGGEFPHRPINVVAYQVIVGSFQVTLPATGSRMQVTVPPEYVASLGRGEHDYEVLAIDESGNQTITSDVFTK